MSLFNCSSATDYPIECIINVKVNPTVAICLSGNDLFGPIEVSCDE
jgi:hypothetical protein